MDRNIAAMTIELILQHDGTSMVAIVPAQALSWHRVQLPAGTLARSFMRDRSAPRLRSVLEGLLEDQLLDEPSQMHFALQPGARDSQPIWVASCARAALSEALASLAAKGERPMRLVPEWTPQAEEATVVWATGTVESAFLIWTDTTGVHRWPLARKTGIPPAMQELLAKSVALWAEPAVAALAEELLHQEIQVGAPAMRLSQALQTDWNLAQFEMTRRNPWITRMTHGVRALWQAPRWRPARWAALVLAVVQVLGLNAFAWKSRTLLEQQNDTIRATLVTTFPQIRVIVDAPLQMEREVAALRQASGDLSPKDLEFMLGALGTNAPQGSANIAPSAIDFAAGELRLGGLSMTPESLDAYHQRLQNQGLDSRPDGAVLVVSARRVP
jgi:general secretion pathway protein L